MFTNKFSWIICFFSYIVACISFFFLPIDIPIHFRGLIADAYGNKLTIFIPPILQTILLLLSYTKFLQTYIIHFKSGYQKTMEEYRLLIFLAISIIFLVEILIIFFSYI